MNPITPANTGSFSVQPSDSPAEFIRDKAHIDRLETINGISIKEIEDRARPGCYSMSGFLGPDESFKEVLKKDWDTVERLGTTHKELASHLELIIKKARETHEIECDITYCVKDCPDNTIDAHEQKIHVVDLSTRGFQDDIFRPQKGMAREAKTIDKWGDHIVLSNAKVHLFVNAGVLSYIRQFGFYEGGGEKNTFRINPEKIMQLLKGSQPQVTQPRETVGFLVDPVFLQRHPVEMLMKELAEKLLKEAEKCPHNGSRCRVQGSVYGTEMIMECEQRTPQSTRLYVELNNDKCFKQMIKANLASIPGLKKATFGSLPVYNINTHVHN